MKKFLAIIVLMLSISAQAQEQSNHLKFMGIPLDGKISSFNKELQKKGFMLDELTGKRIGGTYIYNGYFAGEKAQVFVDYDEKSKIVYQASAIIKHYTKEQAISMYKEMRDMIETKYSQDEGVKFMQNIIDKNAEKIKEEGISPFEWKKTLEENGYETTMFFIPDINTTRGLIGLIRVYVRETFSTITNSINYNLFISYTDDQNEDMQRKNRIDDL